uniref:Transcription elongation factor n=1 Tax=Gasterosteus aculeatus TaxID=69293 RepID=G3NWE9_GASAC
MTREEDLTRIAKKLDKMVSRNNTEGALDLLRELKSFNMTLKLLQETRIGMSVNGIRKNSTDEEVIALAKLLIKDWKRLLVSHRRLHVKLKHDSSPEKKQPDKSGKEKHNEERRARRADDPSDDEKHLEEPGRTESSDSKPPPQKKMPDPVKIKQMFPFVRKDSSDSKPPLLKKPSLGVKKEKHRCNETKATDMKYKNRVRSRISNLKDPKNPGLRRNVLAGSIDLSRIASMSAQEMASDELKQLRNVLTQEAIREHQMAKTGGTSTDLLQCGKCKKRNCTYNQVQTRSADEPMTTFVLCNECGNRWKFS